MPRNKVSNDLDHVKKVPKPKKAPKHPPRGQKHCLSTNPSKSSPTRTDRAICLRPSLRVVAPDNPYAIFNLFFDEATLRVLVQHTNEYAYLYPGPTKPETRTWFPTTIKEFRAYLGVSVWMGLHPESGGIEVFWNGLIIRGQRQCWA